MQLRAIIFVLAIAGPVPALADQMPFPGPEPSSPAVRGLDVNWDGTDRFSIYLAGKTAPLASSAMNTSNGSAFADEATGLRVAWRVSSPANSCFVRQQITLTTSKPVAIDRIEMFRRELPGAKASGPYDGMPVVGDTLFLGIEHPMARNQVRSPDRWSPREMRARMFDVPVAGITGRELLVRFDYQSGSHRIDVARVALLNADGNTIDEDIHEGFSGNAVAKNAYRLAVPAGMNDGSLRVTLGGNAGETDSSGKITVIGATIAAPEAVCSLPCRRELTPGETWTVSAAVGAYPPGQLRRAFLHYLEQSRAHPYRQYWHYNTWYDLAIGCNDNPDPLKRMTEGPCVDSIAAIGRELYEKRDVKLDGYVCDDGWDDWNSLWGFHPGFPNGFTKLKEAAARQGAGLGTWLSPWGGYGGSQAMRVKFGREQGYETNDGGFSLAGGKYYAVFRDTCLQMIRDYNLNYFKFDGIGGGTWADGASGAVAADLDALIRLTGDLRKANPDVFINCTVGTWPSPYWTFFADSIWRGGEDFARAGEGNPREQWITYRDGVVHDRFVEKSPLYPLNSVMFHGLIAGARSGPPTVLPAPAKDLASYRRDVWMLVGSGTGLGELYITPSVMTPEAWDILADAVKWSRAHRNILRDTHWVGGKPGQEVYGYAAWHPAEGGTIVLRNSTGKPQTFPLDIGAALELPAGAQRQWKLTAPFKSQSISSLTALAGTPRPVTLQPFEVLIFDAR